MERELVRAAAQVGARDVFVFRRVQATRFVHVGGLGRGEGWAGLVELRLEKDVPGHASRAAALGRPVRVSCDAAECLFGPYFGRSGLFVPLSADVIVVFADAVRRLEPIPDAEAATLAELAAQSLDHVSPAKRLADELELLHAVQDMVACEASEVAATAGHIVERAAAALSCEIGILYLPGIEAARTTIAERGAPIADPAAVEPALAEIVAGLGREALPLCEQDARLAPLPPPFRFEDGVRSYYLLSVGRPQLGVLLLLHTEVCPRGFTSLCQDLGARLAYAAEALLRAAMARTHLQEEIERIFREARTDSLTGAGNRLAWQEALQAPGESAAAVLIVDLDNLKRVNDAHGHDAGDEHLRATYDILSAAAGPSSVVARIGGDEFAVLLPVRDRLADVVAAIDADLARRAPIAGQPISFALGCAVAEPGEPLCEVQRRADAQMYVVKRERRLTAAR